MSLSADDAIREWGARKLEEKDGRVKSIDRSTVRVELGAWSVFYSTLTGGDEGGRVSITGRTLGGHYVTLDIDDPSLTEVVAEVVAIGQEQP